MKTPTLSPESDKLLLETKTRITKAITHPCAVLGKYKLQWYLSEPTQLEEALDFILEEQIAKVEQRVREEEREKIIDRLYNSEISGWETYDIQCILEVINGEVK